MEVENGSAITLQIKANIYLINFQIKKKKNEAQYVYFVSKLGLGQYFGKSGIVCLKYSK